VTTVTNAASAVSRIHPRKGTSFFARLGAMLVQIRSTAGEGLEATIARAIDEAFASIAREYRR
jgi:hypothetical protein